MLAVDSIAENCLDSVGIAVDGGAEAADQSIHDDVTMNQGHLEKADGVDVDDAETQSTILRR